MKTSTSNPKGTAAKATVKTKESAISKFVKRSVLFFKNPKNGNLVCYQRAIQLHLLGLPGIEVGVKNPATDRLITSYSRALSMKLIGKDDLKHAAIKV